jgi:hypothetical protein
VTPAICGGKEPVPALNAKISCRRRAPNTVVGLRAGFAELRDILADYLLSKAVQSDHYSILRLQTSRLRISLNLTQVALRMHLLVARTASPSKRLTVKLPTQQLGRSPR